MWLVILVAVANLAIGFAVAANLGRRMRGAAPALPGGMVAAPGPRPKVMLGPQARPAGRAEPAAVAANAVGGGETIEGIPEELIKPMVAPPTIGPLPPDDAAPQESSLEQVARLDRHTGQYQQQVTTIDDQLRRAIERVEPKEISSCVEQLGAAHREFLQYEKAIDRVELPIGAPPELEDAHQRLAALWRQQCLEVSEADRVLGEFQPSDNLPEQCQELIERNRKLLAIGHELRDTLGETLAGMARAEPAERSRWSAEREADDATLNRTQLEGFLTQWWLDHPQGEGHLSVAAVDVDTLEAVNQEWGPLTGDHVLRAVSQVLAGECGKASPICQFKGDTFVVLMPDVSLQEATTLVERARQQIEHTRFSRQERTLQVTVSCGVTETAAGDDTEILKERVAATLNEAKRYGHNRTFAHEGKYPTPVMPPSFDVAEKSVAL